MSNLQQITKCVIFFLRVLLLHFIFLSLLLWCYCIMYVKIISIFISLALSIGFYQMTVYIILNIHNVHSEKFCLI